MGNGSVELSWAKMVVPRLKPALLLESQKNRKLLCSLLSTQICLEPRPRPSNGTWTGNRIGRVDGMNQPNVGETVPLFDYSCIGA